MKSRGAADTTALGTLLPGVSLMALVMTFPFNDLTIPLFGVPLTVIFMAAGGALVSFAYGKPEKSRKKLYMTAAANTFLAAIFVAVIPRALGWEWSVPRLEPAFAAGVAWAARWAIPNVIKLVPDILRKVFRLDEAYEDEEYKNTENYERKYDKYLKDEDENDS